MSSTDPGSTAQDYSDIDCDSCYSINDPAVNPISKKFEEHFRRIHRHSHFGSEEDQTDSTASSGVTSVAVPLVGLHGRSADEIMRMVEAAGANRIVTFNRLDNSPPHPIELPEGVPLPTPGADEKPTERPDKIWRDIVAQSFTEVVRFIQTPVTEDVRQAVSDKTERPAHLEYALDTLGVFTEALWGYFGPRIQSMEQCDICTVADLIAYAKTVDTRLLTRAIKDSSYYAKPVEYALSCSLKAASDLGYIQIIPRPICVSADFMSVRLIPYAPILLVAVEGGASIEEIPGGLALGGTAAPKKPALFDIFHEVGHYIFWSGIASGNQTFEQWALEELRMLLVGEGADEKLMVIRPRSGTLARSFAFSSSYISKMLKALLPIINRITTIQAAQREFEESFCDLTAVALGGPLSAISLLNTVLPFDETSQDLDLIDEYPTELERGAIIWEAVKSLYPAWKDTILELLKSRRIFTEQISAIATLAQRPEMLRYLHSMKSRAESYAPSAVLQDMARQYGLNPPLDTALILSEQLDSLAKVWRETIVSLSGDVDAEIDALTPVPTSSPDFAAKIDAWSKKEHLPAPFDVNTSETNYKWYGVVQAEGWSNRGTKNNIGT